MERIEIAYQNKDIASKVLAENFKGKSFQAYGLDLPEIRQALPTNIPAVKANELRLDNIFELADGEGIFQRLEEKVGKKERLNDRELMEFIILPLSYRTEEEKQKKIRETVALAAQIQDRGQQLFTLAGILAFTDKVIDFETANQIRRAIEMTQAAQIFEEEKQQAEKQAAKQATQSAYKKIVVQMIKKGYPPEEIAALVSSYSQNDVEMLQKELAAEEN